MNLLRSARGLLDFLIAGIIGVPIYFLRGIYLLSNKRLSVLERFALKSFYYATWTSFFRTAAEISVRTGIKVPKEVLHEVFMQCLNRGYFRRATLLAPDVSLKDRDLLRARLIDVGEKILADHIALMDGKPLEPGSAARTALLLETRGRRRARRSARYAQRLVERNSARKGSQPTMH